MKKYIPILFLSICLIMGGACNASELDVSELIDSDLNIISPGLRTVVLTPPFSQGMNFQRNILGFEELDEPYGPDWVNGVAHSVAHSRNSMSVYGCGIQISIPNPERTYIKSVSLRITYDMYARAQNGGPAMSKWDVLISPCYYGEAFSYSDYDSDSDIIPEDDLGSRAWCHYSEKAISEGIKNPVHRSSTRRYKVGAPVSTQRNNYTGIRLWAWARAQSGRVPMYSGASCRVIAEIESITLGYWY